MNDKMHPVIKIRFTPITGKALIMIMFISSDIHIYWINRITLISVVIDPN